MLVMQDTEVKRRVCEVGIKIPGVSGTLLAVVMATVAVLTSIGEKTLVEIMKMGQGGKKPWMTCETTFVLSVMIHAATFLLSFLLSILD